MNKKHQINLLGIAKSYPQKAEEWRNKMEHVPCQEKCGKNLLCGHSCQSKCHSAEGEANLYRVYLR